MVSLANAFAARGYSTNLVLASATGPYLQSVTGNVTVIDLQSSRVMKAVLPLARYLRQKQPIALLSAMTHANVAAILAHMLALVSTRLVISERTTISMEFKRFKALSSRFIYAAVPLLYRRADRVLAVSQAAAEDLSRFTGMSSDDVEFIYNPFDLNHIRSQSNASLDHPWFQPAQPKVVLAIGRLDSAKDYPTLIEAFARLRSKGRNIRLMILGEGQLRGLLEANARQLGLTEQEIQLPGFVPNPFAYLARCGVFVLSSCYEGLPGVLIEAMACGAPVVSTDCPSGPREILHGGRWGALVPVGDIDALAESIDTVLTKSREELPDVGIRAFDFQDSKAVDAYLKVLGFSS